MPTAKPEEMTHLNASRLVSKDHPRIRFRGKVDSLQAQIVMAQLALESDGDYAPLVAELEGILTLLREVIRSEVLDEPLGERDILGLTAEELRAQSHDPKKYFGVDPMTPPSRTLGRTWGWMNLLRTTAREAETVAVEAFARPSAAQRQILQVMNRLSSAFHILMCRIQSGAEHGG